MVTAKNDGRAVFDLKGSAFTILVLSLRYPDMDAISVQLGEKIRQAPEFFQNAPVVLDLRHLDDDDQVDLAILVNLVRSLGLVPVGVTGCTEQQKGRAELLELAVMAARAGGKRKEEFTEDEQTLSSSQDTAAAISSDIEKETKQDYTKNEDSAPQMSVPSLIIADPIRSGQRVIAERSDLIVMDAVGSGAEIMASGNIHVYGTLRGRAFAGTNGNTEARIFCRRLEAELVAVAGVHLVNEDFPASLRFRPVQIQLRAGRLHIKAL